MGFLVSYKSHIKSIMRERERERERVRERKRGGSNGSKAILSQQSSFKREREREMGSYITLT